MDEYAEYIKSWVERYPESDVRDIYKLFFQAFHGAEHIVMDISSTKYWFLREWDEMVLKEGDENLPISEPIHIEKITPPIYRINLKPCKASGVNPEIILEQFIASSRDFPNSWPKRDFDFRMAFIETWMSLMKLIISDRVPIEMDKYRKFTSVAKSQNWPVVHHSNEYKAAYDPHYRLVMNPDASISFE